LITAATTWWTVMRIALGERLVYRGDFMLGTLMRFLPIVTQVFLWWAVYSAIGRGDAEGTRVAGYRYEDIVAYFLLTMVGRAFSSMPGLSSGIARQIRDGEIKKYLVQPIDFVSFLFASRVAHKVAYYAIALLPFTLVFFLCRSFFPDGFPPPHVFAAFCLSCVLGFLLGFYLETCLGLVAFWFLEISSLLFVYMLFSFFLSGHMFPLDFLPAPWDSIVSAFPFQYLAYFPAAVFLGKIEGRELWIGLAVEGAWVVGLFVLSRVLYARGLHRYSGYGG
jgi:ABC-2 type transport system permease protein